jgi:hypothetical protein
VVTAAQHAAHGLGPAYGVVAAVAAAVGGVIGWRLGRWHLRTTFFRHGVRKAARDVGWRQ